MSRLAKGGRIDRAQPLNFTFDGKTFTGFAGDTLASALVANDVKLVGRSFKYHRARGILTAGSEEPNALVTLRAGTRSEPNTKATTAELFDGLEATSQNAWPSPEFDIMSGIQHLSRFLGAGFYYKTFMWPASFWEKIYEPFIRSSAGLGKATAHPDPDHYEKAHAFCDVLVIGAGPAGLMAALSAGRAGARVIVADEDFLLGGRLNAEKFSIDNMDGASFAASTVVELKSLPNVRVLPRTTVFGVYDDCYGAVERVGDHLAVPAPSTPRQRLWKIVAKRTVLTAGAIDRPIVFGGNDRPGIMTAQAVQTWINRFAATPAKKLALFTSSDAAWTTAFQAADAKIEIAAIIDARRSIAPAIENEAWKRGIRYVLGGVVTSTHGKTLSSIDIESDGKHERIAVDGLAVSGGFSPNLQLTCHHRGWPVWDKTIGALVPSELPPGMSVAGAASGAYALSACLAEGAAKGAQAAASVGFGAKLAPLPRCEDQPIQVSAFFHVKISRGLAFVDLQADVATKDIAIAAKEGFRPVEHLKRYTALGMGNDQGKTSNLNGLALMADITGRSIPETGTTIFRPPYTPVSIGAFAGHHRGKDFRPVRVTPTHAWAKRQGAKFVETGLWLRAQYFPRPGEKDWQETVAREVKAVRSSVGMIDVSTFGKIDLQGPDVGTFLDRVYVNTFSTLPVGKARYGLMLREDGFVMDDGTTSRLSVDHWVMTTTTVNAVKVFQHLEFCLQVLWPELDVRMASVSEQWAQIAMAGPRARDVLLKIVDNPVEITNAALPVMGAMETKVLGGIRGRVFRLSFSGELGFEIAVPARHGERLADALMTAGKPFDMTPYGTEALAVMRIEKGHVSGPELNGQTTLNDLGFGKMGSTRKDYIGRVLGGRPALLENTRLSLVGAVPVDKSQQLRSGAHLLSIGAKEVVENDQGYLSSVIQSPILGHSVGLGFLAGGKARIGERLRAYDPLRGSDVVVEIVAPGFIDPEGVRLRG